MIRKLLASALSHLRYALYDNRGFASFWYGRGVQASILGSGLSGPIDFLNDSIKVGLSTSTHVPNKDDIFIDDGGADDFVDGELSGTGYTAGGIALASKTLTYDATNDRVAWDAADVTWTGINAGTAAQATVYDATPGTNNSRRLLFNVDTGGFPVTTNGGDLTIQWNASGIALATV